MENRRSEDNEVSRKMWEAVEAKAEKIRVAKAKRGSKKKRKEKYEEKEKVKKEKKKKKSNRSKIIDVKKVAKK